MPQFQVKSPTGETFVVNAPEGATQDQVLAYAQQQFASMKGGSPPAPAQGAPSSGALAPDPQQEDLDKARKTLGLDNSLDNFFANADVGVLKSVGGMIQGASDGLNAMGLTNDVGNRVKDFIKSATPVMTGSHTNSIGQSFGQMLPYVLGGEATAGRGLAARIAGQSAGGAAAGFFDFDDKKGDPMQNIGNRLLNAETGGLLGAALGVGSEAGGALVRKVANSKRLDAVLNSIKGQIDDWKPDATEVAKGVGATFAKMTQKYDITMKALSKGVAAFGGVPMDDLAGPVRDAEDVLANVTAKDPSRTMLHSAVGILQKYVPKAGKDAPMVESLLGNASNPAERARLIAQLERKGFQIGAHSTPGDIGQMKQLSENIDAHLKSLGADADSQASIALRTIKDKIDTATDNVLKQHPSANGIWKAIKSYYIDPVAPLKHGLLADVMSADPEKQVSAITGLLQSGSSEMGEALAKMMPQGAKDGVVRIALHQGIVGAFDRSTNSVDASKFAAFFKDPNVEKPLKAFFTPENEKLLNGAMNLIKYDAHAAPGKGFFGSQAGSWASGIGLFEGFKSLFSDHPEKFAESLAAVGAMKIFTKGINWFMTSVPGRNFLNATADLKPDTPTYARVVSQWMPRLARGLTAEFAQTNGQPNAVGRGLQNVAGSIPFPSQQQ